MRRRVRRLDRARARASCFLPWTTLLYAWMWAVSSDGVAGWKWALVAVAFLLDMWFWVAGRRSLKS